jgi:hypothetical protein
VLSFLGKVRTKFGHSEALDALLTAQSVSSVAVSVTSSQSHKVPDFRCFLQNHRVEGDHANHDFLSSTLL